MYTIRAAIALAGIALLGGTLAPPDADAQIRDRIRDRARQQAERRAEDRAADLVDHALDRLEDAVVCVATDAECIREARDAGHDVVVTDQDGNVVEVHEGSGAPAPAAPDEGVWVNYDFVPGERVIFAEDFGRDRVGDFPRRLEFMRGNMEVAEWRGQRWLHANTDSRFAIELAETLPERFTLEFDFRGSGRTGHSLYFSDASNLNRVDFHPSSGGIAGGNVRAIGSPSDRDADAVRTLRVMADGRHVKVYIDETRVANVPNAELGRSDRITFHLTATQGRTVMLRNFRVAAGGRALYDALASDGRVVTQGILFDTGSDRLRPESTPTLQEIGAMLRDHTDLRLRIEGHTDSVGDPAANQVLSERRAESVRRFLMERYAIPAGRLEAAGMGEDHPIDSNDTPEGRQNNRRVELVRL